MGGTVPTDRFDGGEQAMRILVAEDDPGLQDVIALGLRESGYHVDTVERSAAHDTGYTHGNGRK